MLVEQCASLHMFLGNDHGVSLLSRAGVLITTNMVSDKLFHKCLNTGACIVIF